MAVSYVKDYKLEFLDFSQNSTHFTSSRSLLRSTFTILVFWPLPLLDALVPPLAAEGRCFFFFFLRFGTGKLKLLSSLLVSGSFTFLTFILCLAFFLTFFGLLLKVLLIIVGTVCSSRHNLRFTFR